MLTTAVTSPTPQQFEKLRDGDAPETSRSWVAGLFACYERYEQRPFTFSTLTPNHS